MDDSMFQAVKDVRIFQQLACFAIVISVVNQYSLVVNRYNRTYQAV